MRYNHAVADSAVARKWVITTVGDVMVSLVGWRVSVVGGDHLFSGGAHTRSPFQSALFIATYLVNSIGRKRTLVVAIVPRITGSLLLTFADRLWIMYFGRVLFSISDAFVFCSVPLYVSEIANKEIRGSLGTFVQIFTSIGIVITLCLGPYVDYLSLNAISTALCIAGSIPTLFLLDSPYYLHMKGKRSEAIHTLTLLRGSEVKALEEMKEYEECDEEESFRIIDITKSKAVIKALAITIILGIGSQATGFSAVTFYLQHILVTTDTSLSSEVASVIIGMIQLLASFCTALVSDRFGRKPILNISLVGMTVGLVFWLRIEYLMEGGFVEGEPAMVGWGEILEGGMVGWGEILEGGMVGWGEILEGRDGGVMKGRGPPELSLIERKAARSRSKIPISFKPAVRNFVPIKNRETKSRSRLQVGLGIFFALHVPHVPVTGVLQYLPLLSLVFVVYFYNAGLGSIVWPLSAELFEGPFRALGMTSGLVISVLIAFLTTKFFASETHSIGPAATYAIYSVNTIILLIFIMFCVPETKGKSFSEIHAALEGSSETPEPKRGTKL
ncbi:Facilitated trehalose transporter Tret1 [Eumeta japonica]|uniref:Facilitated trehalose transporter Tret1 n=1 Tax=Eumeta variegata TaxID=151549 RepID=A0A4C1TSH8_EUMVA|nr:Facilitated trehalose transporter Tret1 [Eumeta japonica]